MGVHTLYDSEEGQAVMFCSTSGWAFGPVFKDENAKGVPDDCEMADARQLVDLFLEWLQEREPREMEDKELEHYYGTFMGARQDGMYPKLSGDGCEFCGNDISHHEHCPKGE
jgi:hypothetical protein